MKTPGSLGAPLSLRSPPGATRDRLLSLQSYQREKRPFFACRFDFHSRLLPTRRAANLCNAALCKHDSWWCFLLRFYSFLLSSALGLLTRPWILTFLPTLIYFICLMLLTNCRYRYMRPWNYHIVTNMSCERPTYIVSYD